MISLVEYLKKHPDLEAYYKRAIEFLPCLTRKNIYVEAPSQLEDNVLGSTFIEDENKAIIKFAKDSPEPYTFVHELLHCALSKDMNGEDNAYTFTNVVLEYPNPFDLEKLIKFIQSSNCFEKIEKIFRKKFKLGVEDFFKIQGVEVPCFEFFEKRNCTEQEKAFYVMAELFIGQKFFSPYRELIEEIVRSI